jgi:RNA polymerase sigma factor (sigma-70 family)
MDRHEALTERKDVKMAQKCTGESINLTPGHRRGIVRTIRKTVLVNNVHAPESLDDLVQEVLLRLWKCGKLEKLMTSPEYVDQVATHAVIDVIRRCRAQKRTMRPWARVDLKDLCGSRPRTPEELLIAREEFRLLIKRCRMQLSKRMFRTLVLVHLAGLPRSEVGLRLGLSRAGVDIELHRMRRVLRSGGARLQNEAMKTEERRQHGHCREAQPES